MLTKQDKELRKKFKHLGKYLNRILQMPNFKEVNGIVYKLCTKCKQYFPIRDNVKCGYNSHCKKCEAEKEKKRVRLPAFNECGELRCCVCGEYKSVSEFYKGGKCYKHRNGYSRECKDCEKKRKQKALLNLNDSDPEKFFKRLLHNCVTRSRLNKIKCTLTLSQLINLYNQQNKKCALSGLEMTTLRRKGRTIYNASIDRIIPGGDYSIDNIRLVCNQINMMRSNLTDEELLFLCKSFINYQENEHK